MDQKSITALLAALGLSGWNDDLEAIMDGGLNGIEPSRELLICAAGRIVATWYSIHAGRVEVSVIAPDGKGCRTHLSHPAFGKTPSASEQWDALQILLSGVGTRMAFYGKFRGADCGDDLTQARNIAEKLAARKPFAEQPWSDTPPLGSFRMSSVFAALPRRLVAHALELGYRQARLQSAERQSAIKRVANLLGEKKMILAQDLNHVLGPRSFALRP